MKKRLLLIVLAVFASFGMTACISQKEYDELKEDYEKAKEQNGVLSRTVVELQAENNKLKEEQTATEATTEEQVVEMDAEEADEALSEAPDLDNIEWKTDISYDDLSRRPDDYENEYVEFSGKVVQLIEDDEINELRVATNSNGYDDVIYVGYDPSIVDERILEDDKITFRGTYAGIIQYESTLGGTISVPAVYALQIERQQ